MTSGDEQRFSDKSPPAPQVSFYLNGKDLGIAFSGVRLFQPHLAYSPAVSLSQGEACSVNVGAAPFLYPVPGFSPLQAPPPATPGAQCDYLVHCLSRVAQVRAPPPRPRSHLHAFCACS